MFVLYQLLFRSKITDHVWKATGSPKLKRPGPCVFVQGGYMLCVMIPGRSAKEIQNYDPLLS